MSERWLHDISPEVVIEAGSLTPLRKVNSIVGEGTFAIVEQCKYRAPGSKEHQAVAVKHLRKERLASDSDVKLFLREASVLRQLRSRHIVQYIGSGGERTSPTLPASPLSSFNGFSAGSLQQASGLFLVQELMDGGSLRRKVQRTLSGHDSYTNADALRWALQIARGIQYLHNAKPMVIHRDLKLDNILLKGKTSATAEAKIADFGLSALVPVVGRGRPASLSSGGSSMRRSDVSWLRGVRSIGDRDSSSSWSRAVGSFNHPLAPSRLPSETALFKSSSISSATTPPRPASETLKGLSGPLRPASETLRRSLTPARAGMETAAAGTSTCVPSSSETPQTAQPASSLAAPSRPASMTLKGMATSAAHSTSPPTCGTPRGVLAAASALSSAAWRPASETLKVVPSSAHSSALSACDTVQGGAPTPSAASLSAAASRPASETFRRPARLASETIKGMLALARQTSATLEAAAVAPFNRRLSVAEVCVPAHSHSSDDVSGEAEPVAPLPGAPLDGSLCTSMGMSMFSGMSVLSDSINHLSGRTGSYMYMAPEMFKCESYDASVDVFSFGMIMYELFGRTLMIYNIVWMGKPHENKLYAQRVSQGYRPPLVGRVFKGDLGALIADCWQQDPALRPTINEVVDRLLDLDAAGVLGDVKHCGCRVS